MSLDLQNNQIESAPKTFIRGQTLEFVLELPEEVPLKFFEDTGVSTALSAELRKVETAGSSGFIADLNPTWEAGTGATKIRCIANNTEEWPLGPAVFDVVFERVVTDPASTKKYRSLPIYIYIKDGVTQ